MDELWEKGEPGVLVLPSGRTVRGRGLRREPDPAGPVPSYGLCLLGKEPPRMPWEACRVRRPGFRLPADPVRRPRRVRPGVAAGGRTGTAPACPAVLDGVPAAEAVQFVRRHYDRHAVETPWQRRFVRRFTGSAT
ncbi:protein phosphatase [Streptomyces sp. NPDC005811]|uniref:protein phosphatase n=1 Tax=Streptomyces sp. NPDC005811 TaxID=3154565 RepID=UPI0033FB528C